jgi:hypothetical protein
MHALVHYENAMTTREPSGVGDSRIETLILGDQQRGDPRCHVALHSGLASFGELGVAELHPVLWQVQRGVSCVGAGVPSRVARWLRAAAIPEDPHPPLDREHCLPDSQRRFLR